ncbi:MAG: LamG domain-containing protein, partial [Lentisphaerae bacterium]|nr:LamG domain-containing protein [Lentisphaerota bacterium]
MQPSRLASVAVLAAGLSAADEPMANWSLDDGQGTVAHDSSGGGRHAVLEGAPTWVAERPGLTTLALDGKDDCVVVPGVPVLRWPQSFTLSMWVAVRGGGEPAGVLVKAGTLRLLYYPKRKRFLIDLQGDQRLYQSVPGELTDSRWHLVTLVRNAAEEQVTLSVDGLAISRFTEPIGRLHSDPTPMRIGSGLSPDQPRFLAGAVARINLRGQALSEKEILSMCSAQRDALGDDMSVALPPAPIRDSRWPMLMVDTTQVAVNRGVGLTVCEAVRHAENPVLRLGGDGSVDETRCQFDGSVYYLDGAFRMWYWAMPGGPAYAESDDGVRWTKPNLGLLEFQGSRNNNLVPMPGRPMI